MFSLLTITVQISLIVTTLSENESELSELLLSLNLISERISSHTVLFLFRYPKAVKEWIKK